MHSIKRAVTGTKAAKQHPSSSEQEEYELLKGKLTDVGNALARGVKDTETSQLKWVHVLNDTEDFFSRMSDRYPEEDFTQVKLQRAAHVMQSSVRDGKHDLIHPDSAGERLLNNVRHYIAHIRGMEESYSRLDTAHKDYAMYHQKLDKLVQKDDTEKQVRNEEKYESSKSAYYGLLHSTLERQRTAEARAPSMFRAVYVAYCLCSKGMCKILTSELEEPFSYAEDHHDELVDKTAAIDLNAGSPKAGEFDHRSSTSSSFSNPTTTHALGSSPMSGSGHHSPTGHHSPKTHSSHLPTPHLPGHHSPTGRDSPTTHSPTTHSLTSHLPGHHLPGHHSPTGRDSPKDRSLLSHLPTPHLPGHHSPTGQDSPKTHSPTTHSLTSHLPTPHLPTGHHEPTGHHAPTGYDAPSYQSRPTYSTPGTGNPTDSTNVGPGGATFPMSSHPIGTDPTIVSSATTSTSSPPGSTRPVGTHAPGTHQI